MAEEVAAIFDMQRDTFQSQDEGLPTILQSFYFFQHK